MLSQDVLTVGGLALGTPVTVVVTDNLYSGIFAYGSFDPTDRVFESISLSDSIHTNHSVYLSLTNYSTHSVPHLQVVGLLNTVVGDPLDLELRLYSQGLCVRGFQRCD